MSTAHSDDTRTIVTAEKPAIAPISWGNLFPQIFKRNGEIRKPKAAVKLKESMRSLMMRYESIRASHESEFAKGNELRIIVPGGAVCICGAALDEFMEREQDGLMDLIGEGWHCHYLGA